MESEDKVQTLRVVRMRQDITFVQPSNNFSILQLYLHSDAWKRVTSIVINGLFHFTLQPVIAPFFLFNHWITREICVLAGGGGQSSPQLNCLMFVGEYGAFATPLF